MRRIVKLCVFVCVLWSIYWIAGSYALQKSVQTAATQIRALTMDQVQTSGFPFKFETRVHNLTWNDPEAGFEWRTPWIQANVRSYRLNQARIELPPLHTLTFAGVSFDILAKTQAAALRLKPNLRLEVDTVTATLNELIVNNTSGFVAGISSGQASIVRTGDTAPTYDIDLILDEAFVSRDIVNRVPPLAQMPNVIENFALKGTVIFDRPWDRMALQGARPQPTTLNLRKLGLNWGDVQMNLSGDLDMDSKGVASGTLTLRAANWKTLLRVAIDAGAVSGDVSRIIERALKAMAMADGNPKTLDVPVTFDDGMMRIGFIPIGPAPRFQLP